MVVLGRVLGSKIVRLDRVVDLICRRFGHICEVFLAVGLQRSNGVVEPLRVGANVRVLFALIGDCNTRRSSYVLEVLEMVVEALDLLRNTLQECIPTLVDLHLDLHREQLLLQV